MGEEVNRKHLIETGMNRTCNIIQTGCEFVQVRLNDDMTERPNCFFVLYHRSGDDVGQCSRHK